RAHRGPAGLGADRRGDTRDASRGDRRGRHCDDPRAPNARRDLPRGRALRRRTTDPHRALAMRSLPEAVRPWPYLLAGIGVGFLFLTEFALNTVPLVQAGLAVLACAGLFGVIRGVRALEYWPLFVMAAVLTPLTG